MSKLIVVLINWLHMRPIQMAAFAHGVADAIANNAGTFATPDVLPKDLDDAADTLELAYAKRLNGALAKTEYENADNALDALLHKEAAYVNGVANGNKAIIQLAGFEATSNDRLPKTTPAVPDAAKISGNAALLHLETNNVAGATGFCWLIFTDAKSITAPAVGSNYFSLNAPAIVIANGHFREDLHNAIPAGTTLTVVVMAFNSAGQSGFSSPVSFMVGG